MITTKANDITNKEAYATVGELVLIASALDDLLNETVLDLGQAVLIVPVVATLEAVRKIELLKELSLIHI